MTALYATDTKVLDLWNGASNDAVPYDLVNDPPQDFRVISYDDSAWATPVAATGAPNPNLLIRYRGTTRTLPNFDAGSQSVWPQASPSNDSQQAIFRWHFNPGPGPFTTYDLGVGFPFASGATYEFWLNYDGVTHFAHGSITTALNGIVDLEAELIPSADNVLVIYMRADTSAWSGVAYVSAGWRFPSGGATLTTSAWGPNSYGELGVGNSLSHIVPTVMAGAADLIVSTAGVGAMSLGIATDRTVYTWGYNGDGQLGQGTTDVLTTHSTPVQVAGLSNIVKAEAGAECDFALDTSGVLYGWGRPVQGELAQGDTTLHSSPITVSGGVADFSAGDYALIVLTTDGRVLTVGANDAGQLAIGTSGASQSTFSDVTPGSGTVVAVAGGERYFVLLMADGSLLGAGNSQAGQLGIVSFINTSWLTLPHTSAVEMWVTSKGVWIRRADGSVWATGANTEGQLGIGAEDALFNTVPQQLLVPVGVTPVQHIHGPAANTLGFVTSSGLIYTWGRGSGGGMGNGAVTPNSNPTPISVNGLTGRVWIGGGTLGVWAGGQVAPEIVIETTRRVRGYAQVIG